MAARQRLICASDALVEGGDGVRFELATPSGPAAAFVVRYGGQPRAFLNRCAHVAVELDWLPGKFFDLTGHYLICAAHGAHYEPRSGRCALGPCKGAALKAVEVVERDAAVYVVEQPGA